MRLRSGKKKSSTGNGDGDSKVSNGNSEGGDRLSQEGGSVADHVVNGNSGEGNPAMKGNLEEDSDKLGGSQKAPSVLMKETGDLGKEGNGDRSPGDVAKDNGGGSSERFGSVTNHYEGVVSPEGEQGNMEKNDRGGPIDNGIGIGAWAQTSDLELGSGNHLGERER